MYYGARYYDPALGRFISADSVVPSAGNPQSLNRYSYALNNPLKYTDPTGHCNSLSGIFDPCTTDYQVLVQAGSEFLALLADLTVLKSAYAPAEEGSADLAALESRRAARWYQGGLIYLSGPVSNAQMLEACIDGDCRDALLPLASTIGRALGEGGGRSVPLGFKSSDDFAKFGETLKSGLKEAGFGDAQPIFQGSSVTGAKYTTGAPFDAGRISDFDIAIASPTLLARARELGIALRSGGVRTGPLTADELMSLGLYNLAQRLKADANRPVNFMLYKSLEDALGRGPGIIVP